MTAPPPETFPLGNRRRLPTATPRAARFAAGRRIREQLPRSRHAIWLADKGRPDPIDLLARLDHRRIPRLLPIRYRRMSLSPHAFYRGTAGLMAWDLAHTPISRLWVQLCGDAHLANFGLFATPERNQVFDVNDFDETLVGPWEWDIKRLAVSVVLSGRGNRIGPRQVRRVTESVLTAYRETLLSFAQRRYLDVWYAHLDAKRFRRLGNRPARSLLRKAARKARRRTGLYAFPKLVTASQGRVRIRDDPPLIVHRDGVRQRRDAERLYRAYLPSLSPERRMLLGRYHLVDIAEKVVGVGSVGTRCSVVLLLGDGDTDDSVLLQLKVAGPSVYEPYLGESGFHNHAERVVVGQHLIQEASDSFLGWTHLGVRDFYARQLRDMKGSFDVAEFGGEGLRALGRLCGMTLARAHARTGDPAQIAGYLGARDVFDQAVTRFAELYADQVERDYRAFLAALRGGRLASDGR